MAGSSKQNRMIKAKYERLLEDTRARLESAEFQLEQQQQDFERVAKNFQEKHQTIAQFVDLPILDSGMPDFSATPEVKPTILRTPGIRDASERQSRVASLNTQDVDLGTGADRSLMNLDSTQNDILLNAELNTLSEIEQARAMPQNSMWMTF